MASNFLYSFQSVSLCMWFAKHLNYWTNFSNILYGNLTYFSVVLIFIIGYIIKKRHKKRVTKYSLLETFFVHIVHDRLLLAQGTILYQEQPNHNLLWMVNKYLFTIIVTFIIDIFYFNILGYSSYFICAHPNQDKRSLYYTILENFDLFGPQKGLFGKNLLLPSKI